MAIGLFRATLLLLFVTALPAKGASAASAEAEVSGITGPVKLTLRIHEKSIKVGDLLWEQIRVKNVGEEDLLVADELFFSPSALWRQSNWRYGQFGIYIEVVGPDGKRLEPIAPVLDRDAPVKNENSGMLEIEGPEEKAAVQAWRASGLSDSEIDRKVLEDNRRKQEAKVSQSRAAPPVLKPGQSIETKSWFHYLESDRLAKIPKPQPVGDFSRLEIFHFDKAGEYRVRAVWDYRIKAADAAEYKKYRMSTFGRVLVRTPWVRIKVRP